MRIPTGGQILEDIDMYNRVPEMINIFTAADSRINAYAEGVGNFWETDADSSHVNDDCVKDLPPSASQTVLFKPVSGIQSHPRYLPIRFTPRECELSLVADPVDPNISKYRCARICSNKHLNNMANTECASEVRSGIS